MDHPQAAEYLVVFMVEVDTVASIGLNTQVLIFCEFMLKKVIFTPINIMSTTN